VPGHYPRLRQPPIVEGLLDIQFAPLDRSRLPELEALGAKLSDYPNKVPKVAFAGQISFSSEGPASITQAQDTIGYQFASADNHRIFQARLDGVTLSFLPPYTSFEELEAEAGRLWSLFSAAVKPGPAHRIALRYINRLHLPLPFEDFKEYLRTVPEIAPGIPQGLAEFFMRLLIPDDHSNSMAIVTEVLESPRSPNPTHSDVVLDIDVFRTLDEAVTDSKMWDVVADLRDFKNRIFFGTITPKLRSLYE
jgi:uncharacterized protein (TIGR04255 family)